MKGRILVIDDNEDVLLSLNMLLKPRVEAVRVLTNPARCEEFMDTFHPDVILLDMNFQRDAVSGEEGYLWLERILRKDPQAVVLFITAFVDTAKAVRAIKAGAVDFIPKPWDKQHLLDVVASAVELRENRRNAADDDKTPKIPGNPTPPKVQAAAGVSLLGECPAIQLMRQQIARVAATEASVLITGENGTGKDVVAHLLHQQSRRSGKPFVSIDLGSIPELLFEGELFGYEKGAFTDAHAAKEGRMEAADGGTLFLDEIGNLTPMMQQKLLTVLEKRCISRLGSTREKRIDVRLISATNADLGQRTSNGTFRRDLLYRINTIELQLPPLRERGNDILLLANAFARQMAERYGQAVPSFSADAEERLLQHPWPGNVRELQHVVERALVMSNASTLTAVDIPLVQPSAAQEQASYNLEAIERQTIMQAVEASNGNLTQAAELLGITRYALYRKLEKYK